MGLYHNMQTLSTRFFMAGFRGQILRARILHAEIFFRLRLLI
jgi:hypothetical protein